MAGRLHIAEIDLPPLLAAASLKLSTPCDILITSPNHAPRQATSLLAFDHTRALTLRPAFWGWTPGWFKQLDRAPHCIPAEALRQRPMYREARRCRGVIPVTGFYVWQTQRAHKQPYRVTRVDRQPFLLAAVRAYYPDPTRSQAQRPPRGSSCFASGWESFALVTVEANALLAPFSTRAPAILAPEALGDWLSPSVEPDAASALLTPAPLDSLGIFPVSRAINAPSCQSWHSSYPIGPMQVASEADRAR